MSVTDLGQHSRVMSQGLFEEVLGIIIESPEAGGQWGQTFMETQ